MVFQNRCEELAVQMLSPIPVNSSRFKIDVRVFSWVFTRTTQKEGKEKITVVTLQKREVSDSKDVLILNN